MAHRVCAFSALSTIVPRERIVDDARAARRIDAKRFPADVNAILDQRVDD
jgi:hypothetical protein